MRTAALAMLAAVIPALAAPAHSGRTNSEGCHNNHKTGGYHCHNGGSRGSGGAGAGRSDSGANRSGGRSGAGGGKSEGHYSSAWCAAAGGRETTLRDGTRPDCELESSVVEFDWGKGLKPYECVGQALHYSRMTGKRPVCILIRREGQPVAEFIRHGRRASPAHVEVRCMGPGGGVEPCPW